ncbi:MAG TPA: molybdate ABC transporter substrate-binding protein [Baekduia sp.]|nr:molybdate ABC transporter substrate-binding protein [Baekduia sp.]
MRRRLRAGAVIAAAAAATALAGCGGDGASAGDGAVRVSAAASLRTAFTELGAALARDGGAAPAFSFAGSDVLAAQIRQGARPDVYAAADEALPSDLHRRGLLDPPRVFATNELVAAVPAERRDLRSLADLGRAGVTIAVGAPAVPVGAYTHTVLAHLPAAERSALQRNVRSTEPDVGGIVGKLTEGAVDAGFVYRSDVRASAGTLRAIPLPRAARPVIRYAAGVVRGAPRRAAAQRFLDALTGPAGRRALRAAGFGVPAR